MKNTKLNAILLGAGLAISASSHAALVDLSSWMDEGDGNWTLQPGNDGVYQTINGDPTVFFSGEDSQGMSLSGEITVQTSSDDDYIGFVLGYNAGDLTNPDADYLLIDWKQGNQMNNGFLGQEGLAISRITDVATIDSFWGHDDTAGVEELQRGFNLGDTGWSDWTTYEFDLVFTDSLVEVFVNGALEISVSGAFSDGSFGFFNFSQPNVLYAGITEDVAPPPTPIAVSEPATFGILALSAAGFLGFRRRK